MTDPLLVAFEVSCPPEHAFDVWAQRIDSWWPSDHTVSGRDDVSIVLEAGVGGRIFERTPEGDEHDWGEITAWEPPLKLSYLWHLRADRADAWRDRNAGGWQTLVPHFVSATSTTEQT